MEGTMLAELDQIEQTALSSLSKVHNQEDLEGWRVAFLGRNSPLMRVFDQLGQLPKAQRPLLGRRANQVKQALEANFAERENSMHQASLLQALQVESLDVTLPGLPIVRGRLHLTTQTLRQIYRIFAEMGFQVYLSRDVETDEMNFQLLNFPPHHPAREMQDSFYIEWNYPGDNPVI